MKVEVRLKIAGNVFSEIVEAANYQDAKQIALARNPTATIHSVSYYHKNVFSGDSVGNAGWFYLAIIIFLLYVLSKWWMIVLPMAVLIGIFWLHDKFK